MTVNNTVVWVLKLTNQIEFIAEEVSAVFRGYRLLWCFAESRPVVGHAMFGEIINRHHLTVMAYFHS